jgi:hypothetical protein
MPAPPRRRYTILSTAALLRLSRMRRRKPLKGRPASSRRRLSVLYSFSNSQG